MRPEQGGEEKGTPTVFFEDSRFCLSGGIDCAREAVKNNKTFVSCRLAPGSADGRRYVRMGE